MRYVYLHLLLLFLLSPNLSAQSNDGDAIIGIMRDIYSDAPKVN